MFQKLFFIVCFLFISINVFSQEINLLENKKELPSNIYVKSGAYSFLNASFVEELKLKNFKFLIFDNQSLMTNNLRINLKNIGRKGTKFYYQSHRFRDADLYKHFPSVPDIMGLNRLVDSNKSN